MNGSKLDCKRKTPHGENLFMEEKVSKIWIGRPEPEYRYIFYGINLKTFPAFNRRPMDFLVTIIDIVELDDSNIPLTVT